MIEESECFLSEGDEDDKEGLSSFFDSVTVSSSFLSETPSLPASEASGLSVLTSEVLPEAFESCFSTTAVAESAVESLFPTAVSPLTPPELEWNRVYLLQRRLPRLPV